MRITGTVDGDLNAILAEEQSALAVSLRAGMAAAADAVQADLRNMTAAAGLGPGLTKAWQKQIYPRGSSSKTLSPAALVYGKSKTLFTVFSEGATILPKGGRYLAIPTKQAEALGFALSNTTRDGKGGGNIPRRVSLVQEAIARLGTENIRTEPAAKGRRIMIYRPPAGRGRGINFRAKGGGGLGVVRGQDVPLFILVPQVRLRSRLDLDAAQTRADATLAAAIGAALG